MRSPVDFGELVAQIKDSALVGPDDLAASGGRFPQSHLQEFLGCWDFWKAATAWKLWNFPHEIFWTLENTLPPSLGELERGRLFGELGDLEIRRHNGNFLWHFVGIPTALPLLGDDFAPQNYWDFPDRRTLREFERSALLWGKREGETGRWHDDRVAWARLEYPGLDEAQRVVLEYAEYLDGGRVELVRLLRLIPAPASEKGLSNA